MEQNKVCRECGRELGIENYYRGNCKDGYMHLCKECFSKKYRADKKERSPLHKVFTNPELARFTPRQLMDELAARGYHASGTVTKDFSF